MSTRREVRDDQHGTITGYNYGCRCPDCRAARSDYYADGQHSVGEDGVERVYAALEHEADFDGIVTATGDRLGELAGLTMESARRAVHLLAASGRCRIVGTAGKSGVLEVQLVEAS